MILRTGHLCGACWRTKIANQNGLDGEYFALTDLQARWIYTRQGVHKLARSKGFPAPALTVSLGRVRLWSRFDIEAFERAHPEVLDEGRKQAKIMRNYLAAISK